MRTAKLLTPMTAVVISLVFLSSSVAAVDKKKAPPKEEAEVMQDFVGVQETKAYHKPACPGLWFVPQEKRIPFKSAKKAEAAGYFPDGLCVPERN